MNYQKNYRRLKAGRYADVRIIGFDAIHPGSTAAIRQAHGHEFYDRESIVRYVAKETSRRGKGKSRSTVWLRDNLFCKTVNPDDRSCLQRIINALADHHRKKPGTLLVPFLDWLVVKTNRGSTEILVMPNIEQGMTETAVTWDLKGSSTNRSSNNEQQKKDRDICAPLWTHGGSLCGTRVYLDDACALKLALFDDTAFLARQGTMDYSLLVRLQDQWFPEAHHATIKYGDVKRDPRNVWLRVYLIDFLQPWNMRKRVERFRHWLQRDNASAIEPLRYKQRFDDFCEHLLQEPPTKLCAQLQSR